MTLKCKAKFKQKLICGLGDDKNNLASFEMSSEKLQMWNFHGLLLSKVYSGWAEESTEVLCLIALKIHVSLRENRLVVWKMTWTIGTFEQIIWTIGTFLQQTRGWNFQISLVCVFSKGNRLNKKVSQEFRFVMLKGFKKFGQKENSGFQFIFPQNWWISFSQARGWKIYTLLV